MKSAARARFDRHEDGTAAVVPSPVLRQSAHREGTDFVEADDLLIADRMLCGLGYFRGCLIAQRGFCTGGMHRHSAKGSNPNSLVNFGIRKMQGLAKEMTWDMHHFRAGECAQPIWRLVQAKTGAFNGSLKVYGGGLRVGRTLFLCS